MMRSALTLAFLLPLALWSVAPGPASAGGGVVFEQTPDVPYDDPGTRESLVRLKELGAKVVALVPFIWQREPGASDPVPGGSVSLAQLRAGVRAAKEVGMTVAVKPHVWVPGAWAGAVAPGGAATWRKWFDGYTAALLGYARAAQAAGADVFFVGTELRQSLAYPDAWRQVIRRVRQVFDGRLAYAAHGLDDLDRVTFADALEILAVTLYPPLDDDPAGTIERIAADVARRARDIAPEVWVAEVGLRSAEGSLLRPWESPEEREAPPDTLLQAETLAHWLAELDRPQLHTALIYRWFTDPRAGGPADTDFTPQNKPAEGVLLCAWRHICGGSQR